MLLPWWQRQSVFCGLNRWVNSYSSLNVFYVFTFLQLLIVHFLLPHFISGPLDVISEGFTVFLQLRRQLYGPCVYTRPGFAWWDPSKRLLGSHRWAPFIQLCLTTRYTSKAEDPIVNPCQYGFKSISARAPHDHTKNVGVLFKHLLFIKSARTFKGKVVW